MKSTTEAAELQDPALPLRAATLRFAIRDWVELAKPRMNLLILATTGIGLLLAWGDRPDILLLSHTLGGTALLAASAAMLNQVLERRTDARMERTRHRPLPAGRVRTVDVAVVGALLGAAGGLWLATAVNGLTAGLGLLTLGWYLALYTPLKQVTPLNTAVGAVPGALPPMMGFAAAEGVVSSAAWAVFAILFVWQIPHFLGIATMYREDYARGGHRMLPCVDPTLEATSRVALAYAVLLLPVSWIPTLLGTTGIAYAAVATLLGLWFIRAAVRFARARDRAGARRMFFASIIYLPLLLGAMLLPA